MRKSFKKGLALALAAALAFSTPVALGNTTVFAEEGDTEVTETPANPTSPEDITGSGWWDGPNENSSKYYLGENGSAEFYITHTAGATGVVLEAGSEANGYFDVNMQGVGNGDMWGDLIDAATKPSNNNTGFPAMGTIKVNLTREGTSLHYVAVNTETEETMADLIFTLTCPAEEVLGFYVMATDGSFTVSPYMNPTKSDEITGSGWWDGPNENSSKYYIGKDESIDIYVTNTAGATGVVLEAGSAANGYFDVNMQGVGNGDMWGDLIDAATKPSNNNTGFPAMGTVKVSLVREGTSLHYVVTNVVDGSTVADLTFTLTCPENEVLGFYIMATDGSFTVGPSVESIVSLIKDMKVDVTEDGSAIKVTATKEDEYDNIIVKVNGVEDEEAEITVENDTISYTYVPAESGTYEFELIATKTDYPTDTEKASIDVIVEDGKIVLDADLVTNLQVTDGGEVYNVTWENLLEGVTGSVVVSAGEKTIATTDNNGTVQIKKSDMTSGVKYTVTLTASKEGYVDKKLTTDVTYTAPKEDAPGSKPGTDLSKITAKPVLSYTFDDAKGIETAGDAKVSGGVLNLASTITQANKSYAKIGSLADYDFSKGFTWTADVKVNAATSTSAWTSILMLGDSTPGNELKSTASSVGYHFTTELSSVMDYDKDFEPNTGKGDNETFKLGFCGSGHTFPYNGTGFDANVDTGVGATPLNGYTFDRYEWYKDPSKCGRWDTITVTVTKDTMTLYFDGEAQLTYKDTNYAKILEATKKFTSNYIGTSYWSGDFDFSGSIDNLAFYNTALSAEDVAALTSTKSAGGDINVVEPPKPKKITLTNISAKAGAKKITGTVNAPNATIEVQVGKGAFKKATVTGTKFSIATSKLKIGTKITFKVKAEGYDALTWYKIVRGDFKLSAVKAKKGKKKITGKVNVKKATVKIKVGKKGYKKAKLKGKKFTLKTKKLKKGTKVKIKVTKKNYNTLTKTYKVK